MSNREGTRKIFGTWIAAALLAAAAACSSASDSRPSGMCTPSAQPVLDPAAAEAFCLAEYGALCDRGFSDCAAQIGLTGMFANAAECRTFMSTYACGQDFASYLYDAPCAASCVDVVQHGSCDIFLAETEPQACSAALTDYTPPPPPPPPPPSCTATITPGTFTDTITSADPVYDGGYSHTFCIALAANQTIRIQTMAPLSGSAIGDTVVHLLDPSGTEIAYNDDGSGLYSLLTRTVSAAGQYRIVVRGYSMSRLGSYQLSVSVY